MITSNVIHNQRRRGRVAGDGTDPVPKLAPPGIGGHPFPSRTICPPPHTDQCPNLRAPSPHRLYQPGTRRTPAHQGVFILSIPRSST